MTSDVTSSILQINNLTKSYEGSYHCVYDHNGAILTPVKLLSLIKIASNTVYMLFCSDVSHVLVVMVEFTQMASQSMIMLSKNHI